MNKLRNFKKNISKNGSSKVLGTVITLVILIAFFMIMISIFFGDGLLSQGADKIRALIRGVPEVDQSTSERDFFRNNDAQLSFLSSWNNNINYAIAGPAPNGGCIMTLKSLEVDGFYMEGGNYNLYIEQSGTDIVLSLTQYIKQDVDKNNAKVQKPVTTSSIPGAQLCIIQGTSATTFYDEFNEIKKGEVPDMAKVKPVPVNAILISSGKEEDTERKIGYSVNKPKNKEDSNEYTWETFFKKNNAKTIIYALRIVDNGVNFVCLFPTYNDIGFSTCGDPKNGLMQTDCFDADAGEYSLKYNLDNGFIPSMYVCSDTAPLP